MAGLVTASRIYPTYGVKSYGSWAGPTSDAIHVLLGKERTWMPGIKPGMTAERPARVN
jgi:hypothetical protein